MGREIRFRYWNNQAKKYHYGQNQVLECLRQQVTKLYDHESDGCFFEQFTGLHDKNGREIYEGDIVYSKSWKPQKQEVTFDRGGFCLKYDNSGYYPDIKYAEQMEVIGNIHENPELLEPSN